MLLCKPTFLPAIDIVPKQFIEAAASNAFLDDGGSAHRADIRDFRRDYLIINGGICAD